MHDNWVPLEQVIFNGHYGGCMKVSVKDFQVSMDLVDIPAHGKPAFRAM